MPAYDKEPDKEHIQKLKTNNISNGKPIKYLIHMPTMRVPKDVIHSTNAYLAFRGVILAGIVKDLFIIHLLPRFWECKCITCLYIYPVGISNYWIVCLSVCSSNFPCLTFDGISVNIHIIKIGQCVDLHLGLFKR